MTLVRLEMLNMGRASGKAKVAGTVMGIGGAMILTFYKGIEIHLWSTHLNIIKHMAPHTVSSNHIWGIALATGTCLSSSLWLIIQAKMSEKFPWVYTSAALMSVMAAIQSVIFALFLERDLSCWKLGWNTFLLTAIYTGVVASGVAWILVTCCVRQKGPLYASMFHPLFLVLVAIVSSFLLDERLHLGSLIGSILIIMGLYTFLWGKGKEMKKKEDQNNVDVQDSSAVELKITNSTNNIDHHHQEDTIKTIIINEDKSSLVSI
ncbi:hypothetical protein K1719_018788 [Acacia pycnantha]|nr:hypothetical protein K1719_018788 [Acacia pycnantha]